MFDLRGKTALVVGAASGIGQASALGVAAFGANTFCADVNLAGAEETARMAREQGGQAQAILLDMRDSKGMADALKDVAADILVSAP
ncbi:MAG: SDR family NAD(P)-dependent oxidoreductase, partial [Chloroflexota bacterium]